MTANYCFFCWVGLLDAFRAAMEHTWLPDSQHRKTRMARTHHTVARQRRLCVTLGTTTTPPCRMALQRTSQRPVQCHSIPHPHVPIPCRPPIRRSGCAAEKHRWRLPHIAFGRALRPTPRVYRRQITREGCKLLLCCTPLLTHSFPPRAWPCAISLVGLVLYVSTM